MTLCKHRVVRAHRSLLSVLSVTIAADVFFACPLLPKHQSPLHAPFSYSLLRLLLYLSLYYSLLYPSLSYSVLCLLLYPSLCQLLNALLPRETFIKIYIISPNILNMRFLRQKLCYTGPIYQMWQPLDYYLKQICMWMILTDGPQQSYWLNWGDKGWCCPTSS